MPEEGRKDRVLDALVSNTEALTHLNMAVSGHHQDYAEGRQATRENLNGLAAKVDNLDRSVNEMRHASDNAEKMRQAELRRIYDLLAEERKDRREAVSEGREGERDALTNERDHVRQMVREEMVDAHTQRDRKQGLIQSASKEIWDVGGKYVIASLCIIIVFGVMKLTGISLAEIIGLVQK